MLTINDGRKALYQWDTGITARVDVDCEIVHFSNLKFGDSLAVQVKNGNVAIPNQLLISGSEIYCWAFITDDEVSYTKQEQTLSVIKRAKPSDYVYTETEILTVETIVKNVLGETSVPRMPVIDADMKEDTPEGRVYNEELHKALMDRDRVYAEAPAKDGGGVSSLFYLSANADKLFDPLGYISLEEMCADIYLPLDMAIEGEHYKAVTVDGVTSYHARLFATVARTRDGQLRVNPSPKDSTDATSKAYVDLTRRELKNELENYADEKDAELKQYVDKYSLAKYANQSGLDTDPNAKNGYKVMMLGSKAKSTYLTGTSVNGDANTFLLRLADGSSRSKMPVDINKADSTTLVNLGFFNNTLKEYAKTTDIPASGSTVGEWMEHNAPWGGLTITESGVYEYFIVVYDDNAGGFCHGGTVTYPKEFYAENNVYGQHMVELSQERIGSNFYAGSLNIDYSKDSLRILTMVNYERCWLKVRKIRDI